eukprot:8532779-Pyramimonas_sp.AAC.1
MVSNLLAFTGTAAHASPGNDPRVEPRWGHALEGIDNVGGAVGPDYRREIKVIVRNASSRAFAVEPGGRIAQLILERIIDDAEIM